MTDQVPTKELKQKIQRITQARFYIGCNLEILLKEGAITQEQYEDIMTVTGARM